MVSRRAVPGWCTRLLLTAALAGLLAPAGWAIADTTSTSGYIVQATSVSAAAGAVQAAGGTVSLNLPLVNGVLAQLPAGVVGALQAGGYNVTPDLSTDVAMAPATTSTWPLDNVFPQVTGASSVTASGDSGQNVGVAVIDTGIDALPDFAGRLVDGVDFTSDNNPFKDDYGHGTFVAGLIAGNGASSNGTYVGEAPGANLISVKVSTGATTDTATVITAINWVINNATRDNIRVLNLSLGEVPPGPTAQNPLDQAVESAWKAGIVVVASAGNSGPNQGTIVSPGDDPLVLTAGAISDSDSTNWSNWTVPSWSSVGPTNYNGWWKPDLLAPGGSVVSLAAPGSYIDTTYPSAQVGSSNFVGSGTSFATAITSGAVALLVQSQPALAPKQVKAALLTTTNPGPGPPFNPFVEGHGVLNVGQAVQEPQVNLSQSGYASAPSPAAGSSISLSQTMNLSSWNSSNYSGPATTSSAWNSSAWNSSAWNSSAWNSSAWNSSAWNSSAWNSSAWNSSAWNSSAWNSDSWG